MKNNDNKACHVRKLLAEAIQTLSKEVPYEVVTIDTDYGTLLKQCAFLSKSERYNEETESLE